MSRFTLQFDSRNPKHLKTINLLNNLGRRKASIISDALELYLQAYQISENQPEVIKKPREINKEINKDTSKDINNEVIILTPDSDKIDDETADKIMQSFSAFANM